MQRIGPDEITAMHTDKLRPVTPQIYEQTPLNDVILLTYIKGVFNGTMTLDDIDKKTRGHVLTLATNTARILQAELWAVAA